MSVLFQVAPVTFSAKRVDFSFCKSNIPPQLSIFIRESMHNALPEILQGLGLEGKTPTLIHNANRSIQIINESRAFLSTQLDPSGVPFDVVALGSLGRQEASAQSDFDCLVLAHELPSVVTQSRILLSAVSKLRERLHLEPPGQSRMFGRVISAADLTEFIGLEDDTNRSLTHRILVLGESVSLYQPRRHEVLIRKILERYLIDYPKPKRGVPRFLLNDVLRYWRTLAVDYQAKRWEEVQSTWGLRYLKLLISRKIAFAGILIPILLCEKADVDYFVKQMSMPSLARIAQLKAFGSEFLTPLRNVFEVSEEFATMLADKEFREEAKKVVAPSKKESWPARFREMRRRADDLQNALEAIFFDSALLGKRSKRYLSF